MTQCVIGDIITHCVMSVKHRKSVPNTIDGRRKSSIHFRKAQLGVTYRGLKAVFRLKRLAVGAKVGGSSS
jgi:hypothetical protein